MSAAVAANGPGSEALDVGKRVSKASRWPDVLLKFEAPQVPMRGTPCKAAELETGSIKSLRLTETDRRRRTAAKKQAEAEAAAAVKSMEKTPAAPRSAISASAAAGVQKETGQKPGARIRLAAPMLPGGSKEEAAPALVPSCRQVTLLLPEAQVKGVPKYPSESEAGSSSLVIEEGASSELEPWEAVIASIHCEPELLGDASGDGVQGLAEVRSTTNQLRQLIAKMRKDAWAQLQQEYECQTQIWESAALMEAARRRITDLSKIERPEKLVAAQIEAILKSRATDPTGAISKLEVICDRHQKEHDASPMQSPRSLLGMSLLKVARSAIKTQRVSGFRAKLQERLEAMASEIEATPLALPNGESGKAYPEDNELEELIRACDLENSKLEYCSRRVFGLTMSVNAMSLGAGHELGDGDLMGFLSGSFRSQSTDPWG